MLGARGIRGNVWQVDLGLHHTGELDLGFFGSFTQPLQRLAVRTQIDALFALELIRRPVDDAFVPVIPTQVCIAIR